jgi:hypothetical protein
MNKLLIVNNLILGIFVLVLAFTASARLDRRVAKGLITEKQAAHQKRFRPIMICGGLCLLGSAVILFLKK